MSSAEWKAATDAGVRELPELVAGAHDNADDRIELALDELKGQLPW
ncbi:hypothetical protein [Thiobacillus denitrificans]|nr:hypothetical protein [Thiobacillus denitrificans]